jgi:sec-independent protein translocase protein TatA
MPGFIPGFLGGPELIIILAIAVLVFGVSKFPVLGRSVGEAMKQFKNAKDGISDKA